MIFPFLFLAAVELFCFAPFSGRLGFYHDDWANLERLANAGGLLGGIKYYANVTLERPVGMLQYPLLFALGGLHPLPYQLFYLGAEIVEGWLLFILLDRLLGWRKLALLAAAMILIFPTHAVTHLWFSSAAMVVTVDLTLAALIFHHRWIEGGRKLDLAAGQLFYLLGVLNYEIAAFLPLLLAGGLLGRRRADGRPAAQQVHDELREFWPFGASLAAALLWQRAVVSVWLKRNPRLVGFSALHALKAYQAGLECLANRATDVCARMIPVAWKGLGLGWPIAALLFAAAWSWLLLSESETPTPEQTRRAFGAAVGAAIGGFIGACAPYAASADYLPMVFGVMSRTNGVISIAGGLLWATGLTALALKRRAWAAAAAVIVVFCLTFADWGYALQWANSWTLQKQILERLSRRTGPLPDSSVILLDDFPISLEPGGALVFGAHYDIGAALRLTTGRPLSADVISPASRFLPAEALVFPDPGPSVRRYSYQDLYVFEVGRDRLWRVQGPDQRTLVPAAPGVSF